MERTTFESTVSSTGATVARKDLLWQDTSTCLLHERGKTDGKLMDFGIEFFERAYGLNGKSRNEHVQLCEEVWVEL